MLVLATVYCVVALLVVAFVALCVSLDERGHPLGADAAGFVFVAAVITAGLLVVVTLVTLFVKGLVG